MKKREERIEDFSVFDHDLVPKHSILTPEEAKALLEKYHIQPYQLPFITTDDPAAREINAKPGDIIKIARKSPTAGEAIAYRYVIEG